MNPRIHLKNRFSLSATCNALAWITAVSGVLFLSTETARTQAAGDLDPTFGSGGKAVVDLAHNGDLYSLALQADGKIVGGGFTYPNAASGGPLPADFAVCRFNADGTLDDGFGTGGIASLNIDTVNYFNHLQGTDDIVTGIAVQTDGKILAAGYSFDRTQTLNSGRASLAIARFNADGTLDISFGNGGKVYTDALGGGYLYGAGTNGSSHPVHTGSTVVLQPDGKFLIGTTGMPTANTPQGTVFFVQRYNADGSPDGSFGNGGFVTTRIQTPVEAALLDGLVLQSDGKIIAFGRGQVYNADGTGTSGALFARYNADGSPDVSFANGGTRYFPGSGSTLVPAYEITDAQIDPDGKIITAGIGYRSNVARTTLVRLNPDGSLDAGFGSNGIMLSETVVAAHPTIRRQSDGKYLVSPLNEDFESDRYNADGSVDLTYGQNGRTTIDFYGGNDEAYAMLLQPDGKLVLGGLATDDATTVQGDHFALARQLTANAVHPPFFTGEVALGNGVYYLQFAGTGNPFGYYSYLADPHYVYHFDLGYEYVFDSGDAASGVYLYDFTSQDFFYTSPSFPFPYLYDFKLNSTVYYYPDPNNPGRYNTDGVRYFYEFANGQIISK